MLMEKELPPSPWWKRRAVVAGVAALGVYLLFLGLIVVGQGQMIFPAPAFRWRAAPPGVEDIHIPVDDKTFARAWWVPSSDPHARIVIYFHGNAEVLENETGEEMAAFRAVGLSMLLVEYRGYGTSSPLQTSGKTTREDALAALRYLEQVRHVAASDVVICGRSIGSGVAVQLALDRPDVAGMVLLTPITSVADVANDNGVIPYLLRPAEWFLGENRFDNAAKIGRVRMPLLVIAGTEDTLARPRMAQMLTERAQGTKKLVMVEGAGHNDLLDLGRDEVAKELREFVDGLGRDNGR